MIWRTLMKAEIQPPPNFPGSKGNLYKYTKPPEPLSESPNQGNL